IKPNTVTPFTIDLHTADHVFKKGHRIMVQVQSTWFPLYDRNPQKFVPNIFEAKASDFQVATQRIYRSKRYPSSVEIMVLPQSAERAAN
ncbi:MAG: CocE/NonD family hydrolase C-terminal non-catalytic domain-containing protein, partial [Candidatus Acidiferrum sp.]